MMSGTDIAVVAPWLGIVGLSVDLLGAIVIVLPDIDRPRWLLRQSSAYRTFQTTRETLQTAQRNLFEDGELTPEATGYWDVFEILLARSGRDQRPDADTRIYKQGGESIYVVPADEEPNFGYITPEQFETEIRRRITAERREMRYAFLLTGMVMLALGFALQIVGEFVTA